MLHNVSRRKSADTSHYLHSFSKACNKKIKKEQEVFSEKKHSAPAPPSRTLGTLFLFLHYYSNTSSKQTLLTHPFCALLQHLCRACAQGRSVNDLLLLLRRPTGEVGEDEEASWSSDPSLGYTWVRPSLKNSCPLPRSLVCHACLLMSLMISCMQTCLAMPRSFSACEAVLREHALHCCFRGTSSAPCGQEPQRAASGIASHSGHPGSACGSEDCRGS